MAQYGFHFDSSRCTGCKTCELVCKDYHDLGPAILFRRIYDYEGGTWTKTKEDALGRKRRSTITFPFRATTAIPRRASRTAQRAPCRKTKQPVS